MSDFDGGLCNHFALYTIHHSNQPKSKQLIKDLKHFGNSVFFKCFGFIRNVIEIVLIMFVKMII